jgi:nicotinate phosphoribosyltransferase
MTPIIQSLLDTDLYKLTMMQCVLHRFPSAHVEYEFKCRNEADLLPHLKEIQREINHLCTLRFEEDELAYLLTLDYIKPDFIDFLRLFHLDRRFVEVFEKDGCLAIEVKGPWLHTIMFEVPVLAIVNEIYFRHHFPLPDYVEGRRRLQNKIAFVKVQKNRDSFMFSDFGTRRRFSKKWQAEVVETLRDTLSPHFIGTSNIYLAKALNVLPIGTMAHEFLQACQALGPRLADSQTFALNAWTQEYRGRLGIALTDVIHLDAFLRDFDLFFAKLFDGLRHDSGDPFIWAKKVIAHYRRLKVDPKTKVLVFSDSLTFEKAFEVYQCFHKDASLAFGIGTNLTNDIGPPSINIVMKMVRANQQSVAKISDTPEKVMCRDEAYVKYLKSVFEQS